MTKPEKISAIKNFKEPTNQKVVREILCLAGYNKRFIKGYAKIAKELAELNRKNFKFERKDNHQVAFETLWNKLCEAPILQLPDFSKLAFVTTEASHIAVGAVFSQGEIGKDLIIALSRVLTKADKNYAPMKRECLAIVYALRTSRPYLYGEPFLLVTDH